jgi:DNA-binding transcriptional regulator PaaX
MDYQELLATMPHGVDRVIARFLTDFAVGHDHAVHIGKLVNVVHEMGFKKVKERQVRIAIHGLRNQGVLICSEAAKDGGYYMAGNLAEFQEFAQREFVAKIADMSQTLAVLRRAAKEAFGEGYQETLL